MPVEAPAELPRDDIPVHLFFGALTSRQRTMGRKSSGGGTIKQRALASRGKPSQFESASISKKRHNVIGDRSHGGKARSTMQARARSDQIRRETLLIEHQQKGRTNGFVDGRFGEEDEGMPEEDKVE